MMAFSPEKILVYLNRSVVYNKIVRISRRRLSLKHRISFLSPPPQLGNHLTKKIFLMYNIINTNITKHNTIYRILLSILSFFIIHTILYMSTINDNTTITILNITISYILYANIQLFFDITKYISTFYTIYGTTAS